MVMDKLGQSLKDTLKKIASASHMDDDLIKEVVKDIQRALLQADVNVQLVLSLTKKLEQRATTEKAPGGMSSREQVIRIIYEELVNVLGEPREVELKNHVIMMVGLYGQGKTTTIGKLGKFFMKRGLHCSIIAADVHRPAAYDQLAQIAESINTPIYGSSKAKNAVKVVKNGMKKFEKSDVVLIDTSGRHALEVDLITEMKRVAKVAKPDEIFLVLDAAVGQQAGPQAKAFHDAVGITGVILTKLDGTAKGGGAFSAVAETKAPIVYIGTGEHSDDFEKFEPARFISRLLGMGDLQTLLEKAQDVVDEDAAEETARRIMAGKFTLKDMYEQMEMLSGMGPLKKIMGMLPVGLGGKMTEGSLDDTQSKMKVFKVIMDSMTEEEMENPKMIKSGRVKRISRGAGVDPKDVKALLKYYNQSRQAIKGFSSNRKMRKRLMKQFKGGEMPFGG